MSEINGWQTSLLHDLLYLMKSGGTPDTSRADFYGGDIPFVAIDDMTSCWKFIKKTKKRLTLEGLRNSNTWLVPEYSILYSIYATIGVPRINLLPVTTNQAILALLANPAKIDVNYLFYWLAFIRATVVNFSSQTTQSNLNSTTVKSFTVLHPIQLREQTKIAEILSTVDRAIEQTEALIAKQQCIKTGLMQDLLTRGIDGAGRLRTEQTHEFKDSPLGRIPVEWEVMALGCVAAISAGVTLGVTHEGPATVELPYLRVANVQDGYLDLTDVKVIRLPQANVEKFSLKPGDVLMNEGGDFDKLGRGTIWKGEIDVCLHQNHVFKVRPKSEILASGYLEAISSSTYGKSFFIMASKQSTNLASINASQLKLFPVPLPPYAEQVRIEDHLNNGQLLAQNNKAQLKKLRTLKTALMQDLLTGRKRVTALLDHPQVPT
jgi:type I restriction enzyme S subunit